MRLLPRDEKFFDLFTRVAELNVEAAAILRELVPADEDRRRPMVDQIKRLEHEADQITHEVVGRLDRTFITPLDREDIHLLASRLDNVIDLIDGTARRIQMFRPGRDPGGAALLAATIHRATQELLSGVRGLETNKGKAVSEASKRVKGCEEEGDSIYHEWMSRLFETATDPLAVMKWKEIYDTLERTLDQAEDAANVLESISIKHA